MATYNTTQNINQLLNLVRIKAATLLKKLPNNVNFDDLYSAGLVGLAKALKNLNPAIKNPKSYITIKVTGAMLDYLRSIDPMTRTQRNKIKNENSDNNLNNISYNDNLLYKLVKVNPTQEEHLIKKEQINKLNLVINNLPQKLKTIIKLRYFKNMDFVKIAKKLNLTKARISQLHKQAIKIMKQALS